jgi:hypothetical protein
MPQVNHSAPFLIKENTERVELTSLTRYIHFIMMLIKFEGKHIQQWDGNHHTGQQRDKSATK